MNRHTPGPWKIQKRPDGSRLLEIGNPKTGPHYLGDIVCSDADADLIEAAPDMISLLKKIQSYLNSNRMELWHLEANACVDLIQAKREIDAVINKAEGE